MADARPEIPKTVSQRLSRYRRILDDFAGRGQDTVSSQELAARLELSAAQVRKDLAYFGQFGSPGVGYKVAHLSQQIRRILGTDRSWPVALVGLGRLGGALVRYGGFAQQGFRIVALFDNDPALLGTVVEGLTVDELGSYRQRAPALGIQLAILAVPAAVAQEVADALCDETGLKGILNFAPRRLKLPERVRIVDVDLAVQLEQLSYLIGPGRPRAGSTRDG